MRNSDYLIIEASPIIKKGVDLLNLSPHWDSPDKPDFGLSELVNKTRKAFKVHPQQAPEIAISALIVFFTHFANKPEDEARLGRFLGFVVSMLEHSSRVLNVSQPDFKRSVELAQNVLKEQQVAAIENYQKSIELRVLKRRTEELEAA